MTLASLIPCRDPDPFVRPRRGVVGFVASRPNVRAGVRRVLANWLPFLIYALFAAAIPATMRIFWKSALHPFDWPR